MYCPKCGTKNQDDAIFCENCGTKLDGSGSHQDPKSQRISKSFEDKKPSSVIVIIGYIFALLGGLIGIIIGAYLFTRNNKDAKFHGRNMLIIAAIVLLVSIAASVFLSSDIISSQTSGSETWHSVANFTNVEDQDSTSSFHIKGDKYKIKVTASSDSEYGYLALWSYPESGEIADSVQIFSVDIESTTITREDEVQAGPGDFYLKIYSANLSNCDIEVFDYY